MDHHAISESLLSTYANSSFSPSDIIANGERGLGIHLGFAHHLPSGQNLVISQISKGSWAAEIVAADPQGVEVAGLAGEVSLSDHINDRVFVQSKDGHLFRRGPTVMVEGAPCTLVISTKSNAWILFPLSALEDGTLQEFAL